MRQRIITLLATLHFSLFTLHLFIPGFRKRNVSQKRTTGENRDRPYGRGQMSRNTEYRIANREVEVRSKRSSLFSQFLQLFTLHFYFPVRYSLFVIPFSGSAVTRANEQGIPNKEYRSSEGCYLLVTKIKL